MSAIGSHRGERDRELIRAVALFLLVFAIYFAGYSRTLPPTADEMIDFGLAQSLAKWQTVAIDQVSTVGPNPEEFGSGNHRYSKYGPLQAVLSVPLFWLAQRLPIGAVDTVLLLNHLLTALTTSLLYLLVRRLGYRPAVALAIASLVAFGTPLWVHSKRYFGEPTITMTVVATIAAAYRATERRQTSWHLATGFAFSLAVAAKYIDALLLLPVPLYLVGCAIATARTEPSPPPGSSPVEAVVRRASGAVAEASTAADTYRLSPARSWPETLRAALRSLVGFGFGAAPVAGLLLWYNTARFGSPLASGYAHWEGFSTPVWVGIAGFLVSPGKSIFVYTPLLLLLPFWAPAFIRRFPSFSLLLGAVISLHLIVYGSWWVWWGAWAWGARFIVPILPLLALFLAERLASPAVRSPLSLGVVGALGALSLGIQLLGLAVDHTVYLAQLLPLSSKPDVLTLYDLRYQPILHQIPLLTRQWLDFAWIQRTGPSAIRWPALAAALLGVAAAGLGAVIAWQAGRWPVRIAAVLGAAAVVTASTYTDLRLYGETINPTIRAIVEALDRAPNATGVIQMIPSQVVAYDNWQKRALPELGWIEEPEPSPIIVERINRFRQAYAELWLLTETPPKAPSNGVEAMLDRTLVQIGDEPVGRFRLLRYATDRTTVRFRAAPRRFADGISLVAYAVNGAPTAPGRRVDLTLEWRANAVMTKRADDTVFVHLVSDDGTLIAQHDDPPASGYLPTSRWQPGQIVYDDHAIAIPTSAPPGVHLVQLGLYRPATGQRVPLLDASGQPAGDTVTLDLRDARGK